MSDATDAVYTRVGKWLLHARDDILLARNALTMKSSCPYRLVAYHAQQCADKCLKAYLVLRGIDFPYTHNLSRLIELCPADSAWLDEADSAVDLTPYAVTTRYPGRDEPVTRQEAASAVRVAGELETLVRQDIMARVRRARGQAGLSHLGLGPDEEAT